MPSMAKTDFISNSLSSPVVDKTTGYDQIQESMDIVGSKLGSPSRPPQQGLPQEEGSGNSKRGDRRRPSVTVTITEVTTMNSKTLTTTCGDAVSLERNVNGTAVAVPIIAAFVLAALVIVVYLRRKKRRKQKSVQNPSYFSAVNIDTSPVIQEVELSHMENGHVYEETDIGNPAESTNRNVDITQITNSQLQQENDINNSNIYFTLEEPHDETVVLDTNNTGLMANQDANLLKIGSKPTIKYVNTEVKPNERHRNQYFVLEKGTSPNNKSDIKQSEKTNDVVERDNIDDHIYNRTNEPQTEDGTSGNYSKLDRRFIIRDDPKLSTYNTMQGLGV